MFDRREGQAINRGRILILAAENGAVPGGKAGGVGDVIRELPLALARRGLPCTVLTPGYGVFGAQAGAKKIGRVRADFRALSEVLDLYRLPGSSENVELLALEHPLFRACGTGRIYCDDPPDRPFATDANKFALFSSAAAAYVAGLSETPSVVHLNDWHTACYLLLRKYSPGMQALQSIRTVFTIHNLAYQGIRPLACDPSSLQSWFPDLKYAPTAVADPRYRDCINPMAVGIRLADAVNTVSPTYMREIATPGHANGEGLEKDLLLRSHEDRLFGILNGCAYPDRKSRMPSWKALLQLAANRLTGWMSTSHSIRAAHYFAERKLAHLPGKRPATVATSIGRLTPQKAGLFLHPFANGDTPLERILNVLGDNSCLFVLGSGDPEIEAAFTRISVTHDRLVFLNGFDEQLADALYTSGDLFLMPSTFEPCGISQMLAMRAGQPCVVNDVGGLHDTVSNGENGFVFSGVTPEQQAHDFVRQVQTAIAMRHDEPNAFNAIRRGASLARFSWDATAKDYAEKLYRD